MPDDLRLDEPHALRCAEALELMTEFLEEALADLDRRLFESHLADCEGCRIYLSQFTLTIELTAAAGRAR